MTFYAICTFEGKYRDVILPMMVHISRPRSVVEQYFVEFPLSQLAVAERLYFFSILQVPSSTRPQPSV